METHKILFESLDKAEQHFEAGEIRLAQKLVNEVSRSMKAEGKVSNKLSIQMGRGDLNLDVSVPSSVSKFPAGAGGFVHFYSSNTEWEL